MAEFNFDGLLGNMFGSADSELEKLLTAKQKEQLGLQSSLAAAAALLQASGRGPQRIGLGQALGSALQAGQGAYEKGTTGAINQMMLGEKLKEMQRLNQYQRALVGGGAEGTPTPAMQAWEAPGMPVGPTVARGAMMDQIKPLSAEDKRFEDYIRKADIATQYGRIDDADKYLNMAYKIKPQAEVVGQPFEVTDAAGKPLMVQQFKSGKIQTLEGFGPKREIVLQNLGGRTVAIDKSKLTGKESFAQTMTPSEAANLGIRQAEFARGATEIRETPEGFVYVPKAPGGTAMPVMGAGGQQVKGVSGGQPTEAQSNAAGFAQRMELSNSVINSLPAGSQPGWGTRTLEAIPLVGGAMARSGQGVDTQKYDQAAQDWIRAKLRKESGAAIGKDEMQQEYATYFPQVGDSAEKLAQKAEARRVATLGMQKAAGKAYEAYTPLAAPAAPAPAAQPMMSGVPTWDPIKKQYVYQ
jgi:hypothetical protein